MTQPDETERTICPHCGAVVDQGDAFCRRCGARLGESAAVEALLQPTVVEDEPRRRLAGYRSERPARRPPSRTMVFISLFVLLGPLALPMLWQHPGFSRASKIILTAVVGFLTCVVVWVLWFAVDQFLEAIRPRVPRI